jgi:hypothetical protein
MFSMAPTARRIISATVRKWNRIREYLKDIMKYVQLALLL